MTKNKKPLLILSLVSFFSFGSSVNATAVELYQSMDETGYNIRIPKSLLGKNIRCVLISKDGSEIADKLISQTSKRRDHFISYMGMLSDAKYANCGEVN
jgi:hypothetical protein